MVTLAVPMTHKPRVVLVGGTWSWRGRFTRGEWYQQRLDGSLGFVEHLEALGICVASKRNPFVWTSRVNGIFWDRKYHDWDTAGAQLAAYLDPAIVDVGVTHPIDCVITHSHGLQVALMACAWYGARIPLLIDVCGPVYRALCPTVVLARGKIGDWRHVYAKRGDRMQALGELFDGVIGVERRAVSRCGETIVSANVSIGVPHISHGSLLRDPQHFGLWEELGLIDAIRIVAAQDVTADVTNARIP